MSRPNILSYAFLGIAIPFQVTVAQQPPAGTRMMRLNADDAVMLREVMVIVGMEQGKLKVVMVPPADRRPEGMPEIDVQRGDEVGMANGARVSTINELRKAYTDTKPGAEFKMGVRRDGRPIIVSFVRKDDKDLPAGGPMIVRSGPGDENAEFFAALGFGLQKKGATVVVSQTLPHANKEIRKGDVLVSINGKSVGTVADFAKELDATKVGDMLTFLLKRGATTQTVTFPRPEPKGQFRIVR